jgi:Ca2+/Na+ antiporter
MTIAVSYLGDLCASLVGVVLLISAMSKVREPQHFLRDVSIYEVLPQRLNRPVAVLIMAAEPAIGLGLLLTIAPSITFPAGIGLLGSFAGAVSINLARKRRIACGCFGGDELIDRRTLLRLATLIILMFVAWGARFLIAPDPNEADLGMTINRASSAALVITALAWGTRIADLRALLMLPHLDRVEDVS